MTTVQPIDREILHFHLFAGLGGGARGFNAASVPIWVRPMAVALSVAGVA